jgi:hypothetical protein
LDEVTPCPKCGSSKRVVLMHDGCGYFEAVEWAPLLYGCFIWCLLLLVG